MDSIVADGRKRLEQAYEDEARQHIVELCAHQDRHGTGILDTFRTWMKIRLEGRKVQPSEQTLW